MTPQERAALEEMVMQMLTSSSANPNYGAIAPPLTKSGAPEPWDLDAQAKAYNVTQDWADIFSDPAILGGMMPDTVTPEMLEPVVTYEPLPGQKKVQAALSNPNSLEAFIAEGVLADGASATIANIQTILNDPTNVLYPELAGKVRTYPDPQTMQLTYDFDQVAKIANDFQNAIWDDPSPTLDESGQPITEPNSGIPSIVKSDETPQARWFRETGTPLPWDEWDTNQFATPLQQQRRDQSFADTAVAEDEWRDFRSQRPTQVPLSGAERQAYITNMMNSNMTTPDYPGFTSQSNRTSDFEGEQQGGAWDSVWDGTDSETTGPNNFGFLGDAANLYGEGMALAINPMMGVRRGTDALGSIAGWLGDLSQSETRSGGSRDRSQPTTGSRIPTRRGNASPRSTPSRGDSSWATPGGGSQGNGPAQGSRYEAELRLRQQEKDAKQPSAQQGAAWKKVQSQRAQNHKQLADEALRKRMIAQLMSSNITPHTYTMNSRRGQAQQSGFGF